MPLSRTLAVLADEVQSEAKRLAVDARNPALILLVICRRHAEILGDNPITPAEVESFIRAGKTVSELSADEIIEQANAGPAAPLPSLVELLADVSTAVREAASHTASAGEATPTVDTTPLDGIQRPRDSDGEDPSEDHSPGSLLPDVQLAPSREMVLRRVRASLTRAHPVPVVLHGRPGAGRSSVLGALIRQAGPLRRSCTVVDVGEALANPTSIRRVLRSAQSGNVVIVDDCDTLLGLGTQTSNGLLASTMMALLTTRDAAVVLSVPTAALGALEICIGRAFARCNVIELPPLHGDELHEVTTAEAQRLSDHHDVEFTEAALQAAVAPPGAGNDRAHPGLAIERLDAVAAAARLAGRTQVSDSDLNGGGEAAATEGLDQLQARLRQWVLGQDHAIERLAKRLTLTRAQLDMRPERPDGVFLFVGPSGVGKTALARALALELFGDEGRLIRLDMSEYAESWAISRIIGPQPGYVGSTEPQSWLTTRVRNAPRSVVLLDEIEKAHPEVWNIFLQVFDAGRLTDSRGEIADFSKVVIVLTSNLGTGVSESKPVGFLQGNQPDDGDQRVVEVVNRSFRPELINRLDGTIVFRPLTPSMLEEIAKKEVHRFSTMLAARGYVVRLSEDAIRFLATDGYDERYGARHLQRSLERHILEELALRGPGGWAIDVTSGALRWSNEASLAK